MSAWWLPDLLDSQDGGTHFSDKPPVIAHKDHSTFFCLSFQVHLLPWGQLGLSLSQWPKQRVRGGVNRALEHLLLAKTFHDLRVVHSLAARKVTAAISEVSRADAREWLPPVLLLPSDTCSPFCFATPLSTVHLMCPQEGGSWGTDLWASSLLYPERLSSCSMWRLPVLGTSVGLSRV